MQNGQNEDTMSFPDDGLECRSPVTGNPLKSTKSCHYSEKSRIGDFDRKQFKKLTTIRHQSPGANKRFGYITQLLQSPVVITRHELYLTVSERSKIQEKKIQKVDMT
jgi:hypothetical protein